MRQLVEDGDISIVIQYCPTGDMLADGFTKPLTPSQHAKLCQAGVVVFYVGLRGLVYLAATPGGEHVVLSKGLQCFDHFSGRRMCNIVSSDPRVCSTFGDWGSQPPSCPIRCQHLSHHRCLRSVACGSPVDRWVGSATVEAFVWQRGRQTSSHMSSSYVHEIQDSRAETADRSLRRHRRCYSVSPKGFRVIRILGSVARRIMSPSRSQGQWPVWSKCGPIGQEQRHVSEEN